MNKSVRRLSVLLATAGAGFAMSIGPASADTVPGTHGLSDTTKQAWENWDEGACLAGAGAGKMVSGAWVGVPNSVLDLANREDGQSEATKQAWENWDDGSRMLGHGAGKMVSGAWIGVPNSVLDLANREGGGVTYFQVTPEMAAQCQQ